MSSAAAGKILYDPDNPLTSQEVARLTLELEQTRAELARAKEELRQLKHDAGRSFRDTLLLEVDRLTVSFNGFKALDDLSVYVNKDELHAIIVAKSIQISRIPTRPSVLEAIDFPPSLSRHTCTSIE